MIIALFKIYTFLLKEKDEVVASEECQEVFARLQEKGIEVSMETIKRYDDSTVSDVRFFG